MKMLLHHAQTPPPPPWQRTELWIGVALAVLRRHWMLVQRRAETA